MLAAPIPEDEHSRLEALYALRLLDTPAEERFDNVTSLAAELFRVPMAFVSLLDRERQWLKSKVGLNVCETSRHISLCAHAILQEDALVIPDTSLDPRFSGNPLVTGEPFLRFYAGQPLRAPGGEKIGTLCIADQQPREFGPAEVSALRRLGTLLERELSMADVMNAQSALLETQRALIATQAKLSEELQAAARYVRSLLPPPATSPVILDWRFLPSDDLGGDCLGYHELPDGKLAFYVLDVCGHGVGAAMLSVSLLTLLRSHAVQDLDFSDPAAVLTELNRQFQMGDHGGKFFTMWYGVLDAVSRRLVYSSGGHPAAIVIGEAGAARSLSTEGIAVGCVEWARYENIETRLAPHEVLYLFSDGAYEIRRGEKDFFTLEEFERLLARASGNPATSLNTILQNLRVTAGSGGFEDDVSILELRLPEAQEEGRNLRSDPLASGLSARCAQNPIRIPPFTLWAV